MTGEGPPDDSSAALNTAEGLVAVWDRFRAGDPILCSQDGALIALVVDAGAAAYRFVCTRCGAASPWFEATPTGAVRFKAALPGQGPRARDA